jgi:transcriptional regulator with XRE-family HTH domain
MYLIHNNLKTFRNYFNLTQEQLSKLLSIELTTVAFYESGKIKPSFPILYKLIEIYQISLDYLILNENCNFPRNLKLLKLARKLDDVSFSDARSNIEETIKNLLGRKIDKDFSLKQDLMDIELGKSFHKNLKEARNLRKMTQPELSQKISISRSLLSQYEFNCYPPIERLIQISGILDISMHALITGEKLFFDFDDRIFGRTILFADQRLLLEEHKMLIHFMEAIINNKT